MQQVLIHRPGGLKRLELQEVELPEISDTQILVKAGAIGVNFADCVIRLGLYPAVKEYSGYPLSPGFECAGDVVRVGSAVVNFAIGDSVFGVTRFFAYQEYVVLEQERTFLRPQGLSVLEAGSFTVAALTAYYALHELGHLRAGQIVLVHSAAGGVGSALCQLALAQGAQVVAVVSSEAKAKFVRELGVKSVITRISCPNRSTLKKALKGFAPKGFDLACDANGYETLSLSYDLLKPMGRLVVYGAHTMLKRGGDGVDWPRLIWTFLRTPRFNPLNLTNDNKTISGFNLSYLFDAGGDLLGTAVQFLLECVAAGTLRIPEIKTVPLSQVADAHRLIQSGESQGKIVLVPDAMLNLPPKANHV